MYQNAATSPSVPAVSGSFRVSTGTPFATGSWTIAPSDPSSTEFTWRTSLTVRQPNGSGNWEAFDTAWNTPVRLSGEAGAAGTTGTNGTNGTDGDSYRQVFLYTNTEEPGIGGIARPTNIQGFIASTGLATPVIVGTITCLLYTSPSPRD